MDLTGIRLELERFADWTRAQSAKGPIVMYCSACAGEMYVTDQRVVDGKTDELTLTCQTCQRRVTY